MAKPDPKKPDTTPTGTEVATTNANAGAVVVAGDYAEYAGAGFENQTADDYSIPFLAILQALSPQLQDPANGHLRQGMIVNTVTGELFGGADGVPFIPATTQHAYVEWKPRSAGGGFVGMHEVNSELVNQVKANSGQTFGMLKTPDGNELIETFYVYGVALDNDGNPSEAVLSFSSTKIKPYKGWQTKAKTIQLALPDGRRIVAPLMSHRYRLKTVSEKNNKGQFFNWSIGFDGENAAACRLAPNDPLFQMAFNVKKLIESGKARAATESLTPGSESGDEGAQGGAPAGKPVF